MPYPVRGESMKELSCDWCYCPVGREEKVVYDLLTLHPRCLEAYILFCQRLKEDNRRES